MPDSEKIFMELNQLSSIDEACDFEQYWISSVGKHFMRNL